MLCLVSSCDYLLLTTTEIRHHFRPLNYEGFLEKHAFGLPWFSSRVRDHGPCVGEFLAPPLVVCTTETK